MYAEQTFVAEKSALHALPHSMQKDKLEQDGWLDATDEVEGRFEIGSGLPVSHPEQKALFVAHCSFVFSFDEIIMGQCPHVVVYLGSYKGVSHRDPRE